jgi:hypothetical protein
MDMILYENSDLSEGNVFCCSPGKSDAPPVAGAPFSRRQGGRPRMCCGLFLGIDYCKSMLDTSDIQVEQIGVEQLQGI